MRSLCTALMAMVLIVGCGEPAPESADASETEEVQFDEAMPEGNDPCTLVSQSEMEALLGPLAEPPYRVSGRQPSPDGDGCFYRAVDLRNVTLTADWEDGPMVFRIMGATGGQAEDLLGGRDISADTLEVPWDEVGLSFGHLVALKGDFLVQVDPTGSRIGMREMAHLVDLALSRRDSPLRYDGSKATRNRGRDEVRSGDPCSLLSRAEVEAAMGPLRADPHSSEDGSECVFPLDQEFFGEPADRALEVTWNDGFYLLGQERQALGMAGNAMASFMGDEDMPSLGDVTGGEGEPWDEQITLLGGMVTVVKGDVMLRLAGDGMFGFGEEEALGLLRAAAQRIR
jgi:hypothetical protein